MMNPMSIGELERALLERFPRQDAEDWDRVGLSVGDRASLVTGVACALDVTPYNLGEAFNRHANVLLTHHPICLDMPRSIEPASRGAESAGSAIWEAARLGIAVISLHTNLDRSPAAALRMPQMLGLKATPNIESARRMQASGLGAVAALSQPISLSELAHRCLDAFGRVAQVFGAPQDRIETVAFYSGSLGSDGCADVLLTGAQAVICGECGYHRCLDLVARGCGVIALGHDVSELPHVTCLRDAAAACGVAPEQVFVIDEPKRWFSAC